MKPFPQPGKTPFSYSDSLHQRLSAYALAASAAGVGVLALAQPAEARIVYTATHKVLGPNSRYRLDLNHDGVLDFALQNFASCGTDQCNYSVLEQPARGNGAVGYALRTSLLLASALKKGSPIGPGRRFLAKRAGLVDVIYSAGGQSTQLFGQWDNVTSRYLGLKFKIHGKTHYGWARISVQVNKTKLSATLTGYAYETIPNKPIIAGKIRGSEVSVEPATLGHLALGASAVPARRLKQTAATAH